MTRRRGQLTEVHPYHSCLLFIPDMKSVTRFLAFFPQLTAKVIEALVVDLIHSALTALAANVTRFNK
jgi:hypothetical protein